MTRDQAQTPIGGSAGISRRGFLKLGGGVAAAGLAAPLLGACSTSSGGGGGGGGTFTWYTSNNHVYDTWKKVVSQFEKDHNITVNWQKYPFPDMQTKLQADFAAGTVPDLVEYGAGDNAMQFVVTGDVLALDPYIAKDGKAMGYPSDWQAQAVRSWQYQDKTYGIQLQLTAQQLFYNKQMLSDAGISTPPDTWDDLLAAARELTKKNVYGIALNADFSYSEPWMLQSGAQLYDPTAKQFLTPRDAATKALQFQQDLVHKYKVSPVPPAGSDFSTSRQLFIANRAAMILTGPWDIKPIKQGNPHLDFGISLPLKGSTRSTIFAGSGVFIPMKSKHQDLAWDLVKRLTKLDTELALTKEAGQTMPRKSWASDPQITSDPLVGSMAKSLSYAQDWGSTLASSGKLAAVNDAYNTLFQDVVLGGKSPSDALQTFDKAAQAAVGSR